MQKLLWSTGWGRNIWPWSPWVFTQLQLRWDHPLRHCDERWRSPCLCLRGSRNAFRIEAISVRAWEAFQANRKWACPIQSKGISVHGQPSSFACRYRDMGTRGQKPRQCSILQGIQRCHQSVNRVWSPWKALKIGEKMTRLLFGGVPDNSAKKGMVAVEGLSCCCMGKASNSRILQVGCTAR